VWTYRLNFLIVSIVYTGLIKKKNCTPVHVYMILND